MVESENISYVNSQWNTFIIDALCIVLVLEIVRIHILKLENDRGAD